MPRPYALLRAGFPYVTTVGMRRITSFPTGLALGEGGSLYVLCRTEIAPHIRRLSAEDEDLGTVGGEFTWPAAIVTGPNGLLYVSDEGAHTVTSFSHDGERVASWGRFGVAPGELNRPSGLVFEGGDLLIANTQNHRIERFSPDGRFISGWGRRGDAPGELNMPWGIAVDNDGAVYVADWANDRVQKFDRDGRFVMAIGRTGEGDGEFRRPSAVAVDKHGDIYVCDRGNNRVQLFDHRGRYVQQFRGDGTLSKMGRRYVLANHKTLRLREMANLEPQKLFRAPTAVMLGDDGMMYVADQASHRIQVYRKEAYELAENEILPELDAPTLLTT